MHLWAMNVTGLVVPGISTDVQNRNVLSVVSVKAFPTAAGLSQENKAYTPTEAMNTERIGIVLCWACLFITCHSQKNKLLSRENVRADVDQ